MKKTISKNVPNERRLFRDKARKPLIEFAGVPKAGHYAYTSAGF